MSTLSRECAVTGKTFIITPAEQALLARFDVPLPNICPEERHRLRLAHRNERKLYKTRCALSGKPMLSLYSADKPWTVYSPEVWWSDDWDATDYGRDYDFTRSFFDQFLELKRAVPRLALCNVKGENSDYCNFTAGNKNCYLVFGGDYNEDCRYSLFSMYCRDTSDVYWVTRVELGYECIDCLDCYNIRYAQDAQGCRDSAFLYDCRNCADCVACVGLRDKQYCIFNEAYTKTEYLARVASLRLDTRSGVDALQKQFSSYQLQFPHRANHIVNSEHCSGDHIANAKNCINCFDVTGPAEDLKDVMLAGYGAIDLLSCDHVGHKSELLYEVTSSIETYNSALSLFAWNSNDVLYCDTVQGCHDLFGCINMKRAEYSILNKPYKRSAYQDLRDRIIAHMKSTGEWGRFFPATHSPWSYNETVAQDYFPLSQDEVLGAGLSWHEEETRDAAYGTEIPDSIRDVGDGIVNDILICKRTGRPYKIIPQELKFYRTLGIPIPRYAPETRNELRLAQRSSVMLWDRHCSTCRASVQTTFSPDRPERILCEKCYLESIY